MTTYSRVGTVVAWQYDAGMPWSQVPEWVRLLHLDGHIILLYEKMRIVTPFGWTGVVHGDWIVDGGEAGIWAVEQRTFAMLYAEVPESLP